MVYESFLALSDRGALSILDASFKFARAACLVSGEPRSTLRMEQRAFGENSMSPPQWSLRWLDVCVCTDASEKGLAFAVREGCRELALEVGLVSERARFKRSSRSIRAKSRALRYIAPDVGSDCSSSDENEASLAGGELSGLPRGVVAHFGSLEMDADGLWWLLPGGKHHRTWSTFHLVCRLICEE